MKTLTTFAALITLTTPVFAGNLAPVLSEPPVMRPADACERYLVPGTNYYNSTPACFYGVGGLAGTSIPEQTAVETPVDPQQNEQCGYENTH